MTPLPPILFLPMVKLRPRLRPTAAHPLKIGNNIYTRLTSLSRLKPKETFLHPDELLDF